MPRSTLSQMPTARPDSGKPVSRSLSARHTVACEAVMINRLDSNRRFLDNSDRLLSQERGLYAYSGEDSNEHRVCKIDRERDRGVPRSKCCASSLLSHGRSSPHRGGTTQWHVHRDWQHDD